MMQKIALALLLCCTPLLADELRAPAQPENGPGGKSYRHAAVRQSTFLEGDEHYWLFEPAAPKPAGAVPVLVLCHGWGGMSPYGYGAWIEHLVRRGNVVLYPRYQSSMITPPGVMTPAAIRSIADALKRMDGKAHVAADRTRFALTGHSLGGAIAANIAALAAASRLPRPGALLVIQPGDSQDARGWRALMPSLLADYAKIPRGTLMVVLAGADDRVVGDGVARRIFRGATSLLPRDKNLVILHSDRRGSPALLATHRQPFAPDPRYNEPGARLIPAFAGERDARLTNAHDFHGSWKLFDALTDAAFHGKHREYALGGTPQQRSLGRWSDGTPVRELEVIPGAARRAEFHE